MQREDFRAFFVMLLVQMQNVIAAISSSSTQVRQQFVCFVLIFLHFLSRFCLNDALAVQHAAYKNSSPQSGHMILSNASYEMHLLHTCCAHEEQA